MRLSDRDKISITLGDLVTLVEDNERAVRNIGGLKYRIHHYGNHATIIVMMNVPTPVTPTAASVSAFTQIEALLPQALAEVVFGRVKQDADA